MKKGSWNFQKRTSHLSLNTMHAYCDHRNIFEWEIRGINGISSINIHTHFWKITAPPKRSIAVNLEMDRSLFPCELWLPFTFTFSLVLIYIHGLFIYEKEILYIYLKMLLPTYVMLPSNLGRQNTSPFIAERNSIIWDVWS